MVRWCIVLRIFTFALCYAAVAMPSIAADEKLILLTEENPPFNFVDHKTGAISGASVELMQAVVREAGLDFQIKLLPWKRAFLQAQKEKNTCVFSMNFTEERAPLFKWVSPFFREGGLAFFKRADDVRHYGAIEDVRGGVLIAQNADVLIGQLKNEPGIRLIKVRNDAEAMDLLLQGRGDLMLTGRLIARTLLQDKSRAGKVKLAYPWRPASIGLGCSLLTSDHLVQRLREAHKASFDLEQDIVRRYWGKEK